MMRLVLVFALAAGCDKDVCSDVDGTCEALTVRGMGTIDGLEMRVSGAASGHKLVPQVATPHSLPVEVALALASASDGELHVDVTGVYLGEVVGTGSLDLVIKAGAHGRATVQLGAAPDLGLPIDGGFTISGTNVRHHIFADGAVVDAPDNVSDLGVIAIASGVTRAAVAGSGGSFTIPNVPSTPYTLKIRHSYVSSSSKTIDVGFTVLGRPDAQHPTRATTLSMNVSNLQSWSANDVLQLFAIDAGSAFFNVQTVIAPSVGATSLAGQLDLNSAPFANLIDGSKGDRAFLSQLVDDADSGIDYQRLARVATFPSFTIANGGAQSVSAAMVDVPQTESFKVVWTLSNFQQYRTVVNPQATADYAAVDVFSQPGGLAHGFYASTPDLAVAYPPTNLSMVAMTMHFGNPFPASWATVAGFLSGFTVSYTAPGASAAPFDGYVYVYDQAVSGQTAQPIVSPVRSPTINGKSAFNVQTGVGTTPLVAWSAPELGTPAAYELVIYSITNVSGATQLDRVANFITHGLSAQLPSGILQAGLSYFLSISAITDSIDVEKQPFEQSYPTGAADVLTAAITP